MLNCSNMAKTEQNQILPIGLRDADLSLIFTLQKLRTEIVHQLRPSDRHAIRQAGGALERLAERLVNLLSPAGAVAYRTLPKITASTRIRTIPKRLWLEILFEETTEKPTARPTVFVEFAPNKINYGLFVLGFSSGKQRKAFWKALRSRAPDVFQTLKRSLADQSGEVNSQDGDPNSWCITKYGTPTEQADFNADLNDWLKQRSKVRLEQSGSFSIRKSFNEPNPSLELISTRLANVAELFQP